MNKDSFVPDHVSEERTPLPLRRSVEWVQDLPPSWSSVCSSLTVLHEKAALFPLGHAPAIEAATATSIPLYPDNGEKLLTAQCVCFSPLPSGHLFQRKEQGLHSIVLEGSKNGNTFCKTI